MERASPPATMNARPRTIWLMASVVINALMRPFAMTNPLKKPMRPPPTIPRMIPNNTLLVELITTAAVTPLKATMFSTERSKSPEARQKSIVQETIPTIETERPRPIMLRHVKKYGTKIDSSKNKTIKMTSIPESSQIDFKLPDSERPRGCIIQKLPFSPFCS